MCFAYVFCMVLLCIRFYDRYDQLTTAWHRWSGRAGHQYAWFLMKLLLYTQTARWQVFTINCFASCICYKILCHC